MSIQPHFASRWNSMSLAIVMLAVPLYADEQHDEAAIHAKRGHALMIADRFDDAIRELNMAIQLDPNCWMAYGSRACAWTEKREYGRAVADWNAAIQLRPNHAKAYVGRGMVWSRQGDDTKALADCSTAIRMDPQYGIAYVFRAAAWRRKGEFDRAIADCDSAIRLNPNRASAYVERARAFHLSGKANRAIADCNSAISLTPDDANTYGLRGAIWARECKYDRALEDLDIAVRLKCSADYRHIRALLLATCPNARIRNGARAVVEARQLCQETGWRAASYLDTFAAALAETGDFEQAVKWQMRAIECVEEQAPELGLCKASMLARLELFRSCQPVRDARY